MNYNRRKYKIPEDIDLFNFSPKYSNKQKLIFIILNENIDKTFNIQFKIDDLILNNILKIDIINGKCYHPDKNKYKIDSRIQNFWHVIFNLMSNYNTLKEFSKECSSVHRLIYHYGWQEELVFDKYGKTQEEWTKDKLLNLSKLCSSRTDFKYKFSSAYHWALRNNYLDEICEHMSVENYINQANFNKIVYGYIFPNNTIYIGITKNFEKRNNDRKYELNDAVQKYSKETNTIPEIIFFTKYIECKESIKLEKFYIKKYKDDGWNVLNRNNGGSIGGSYKFK